MVDLSDARKKASKMPRKDLHRINRNNVSRRLHNSKIRLDREKLEKIQHALENKKLSLSVTALDDVINSLFSDLAKPSAYASLHTPNLDKLKQVHESVTRSDATKDTRIRTIVAGHNDMSEELRHKNAELDIARTEASDLKDDCQRLDAQLQKLADNKFNIEESFRKCRYDLRQAEFNLTESSRRVANLETQIERTRMSARDADERAESINDELQDANRQLRDSERERAKLEAERDRLQTELKTAKEQLNGEAGLEKKTRHLDAAHELVRQLKDEISALKEQHADVVSNKEKDLRELQEINKNAISRKSKEMQDHRRKSQVALSSKEKKNEDLRNDLTATINAKDAELEGLRAEHVAAITAKNGQLEAKHQSEVAIITRHGIETQKLREEVDSVKVQKDDKVKELDALVSSHDAAMRELRQQLDLVTRQKDDKAQELEDSRNKHIADAADKEKEFDDIVSSHESQMQELRKELDLARDQKADEAEKLELSSTELAAVINLKDAELQEAHYELAIAVSCKESEIGSLHTEHAATIARKDAELKKAHDDYAIAISGKESEIGSLNTKHTAVIARKDEELETLRAGHAAAIVRKDNDTISSLAPQQTSSASEGEEKRRADLLKASVEVQDAKIMAIGREWDALEGIIQNVGMDLLTALGKFGKPKNNCHDAIWARRRQDPERKCKPILYQTISTDQTIVSLPQGLTCLETAMDIRRVKIELEETVDHQCAFIKKFAAAVVEAHPEVIEMAKAIDVTLAPPAQQVVQPTQAPTPAPAPAKMTPEKPPKDTCACGYFFLVTDSQDACRDHLDGCDDFAKWTPEKKTSLLGKLGLTGYKQSKATKPKAESITCWHCEREFDKVHGRWFNGSHIKVTLSYATSIQCLTNIHAF